MSSNVQKCLRAITNGRALNLRLFEAAIADTTIPDAIKRKLTLLYKKDKRISMARLKEDLHKLLIKNKNTKLVKYKGGGWIFGKEGLAAREGEGVPIPIEGFSNTAKNSKSTLHVFDETVNDVVVYNLGK